MRFLPESVDALAQMIIQKSIRLRQIWDQRFDLLSRKMLLASCGVFLKTKDYHMAFDQCTFFGLFASSKYMLVRVWCQIFAIAMKIPCVNGSGWGFT